MYSVPLEIVQPLLSIGSEKDKWIYAQRISIKIIVEDPVAIYMSCIRQQLQRYNNYLI